MDCYRIKVKLGNFEFEAEGPIEVVREQFESFKQMISSASVKPEASSLLASTQTVENTGILREEPSASYDKIFKVDGRVVSLTALPETWTDALLMLLFAQRHYRKNESVTGSEIMDGLQQSGYKLDRIDRQMDKFVSEGLVIRVGKARGTRYRLTNQGLQRSMRIAGDVAETVP